MSNKSNFAFKVAWLDDQKKVFSTVPSIKKVFSSQFKCKLDFKPFTKYERFIEFFESKPGQIDFIFLDINLNLDNINGITVYEQVRKLNKKINIVFVSGHLSDTEWEDKIEELKQSDTFLYTLKLNFPTLRAKWDYYKSVSLTLIKLINAQTGIFNTPYDSFLSKDKDDKIELLDRLQIFSQPFVVNYFEENKEVDWMIIGGEPENILKTGPEGSLLSSKELVEMSELEGVAVQGYQRPKKQKVDNINTKVAEEYITKTNNKSIETIISKILHIEDDHVILKCLIDEETKKFQIRKFDIAPLKEAVEIVQNNIVEIKIITSPGERKFLFKDGNQALAELFSKKLFFESDDISSFFHPKD